MNRSLLEKVWCLLSNAQSNKLFWAEDLEYVSHLMNMLLSTTIEDKTPLDIWSGGAAQDYSLLQVFGYPAYFSVKYDKLNPRAKKCFLESKKFKRLQAVKLRKQEDRVEQICHN